MSFPVRIPFLEDLGVVCTKADAQGCIVELEVKDRHMNSLEVAHGGVTMTLLDVAQAMAGRFADPDQRGVVTIEMKTSFMRPGTGKMQARGRCIHRTSSRAFCEAELVDAQERVVAKASGTFKYVRKH
ncbi:MAG: PaaI family thioesterase [Candidatus Protistobacter heckmanni]|nr:PaaI family thioesterase [Candidatus Protistobacter heckmanni]